MVVSAARLVRAGEAGQRCGSLRPAARLASICCVTLLSACPCFLLFAQVPAHHPWAASAQSCQGFLAALSSAFTAAATSPHQGHFRAVSAHLPAWALRLGVRSLFIAGSSLLSPAPLLRWASVPSGLADPFSLPASSLRHPSSGGEGMDPARLELDLARPSSLPTPPGLRIKPGSSVCQHAPHPLHAPL